MDVTASQAVCVPAHSSHCSRSLHRSVVGVSRNSSGRRSSHQLGAVKLCVAGIGARDDNSAHCMTGALQETSMTQLIVTRVLMKERRNNCTGHKVLDGVIGIRRSVPPCVTLCPLSVGRITVAGLPNPATNPTRTNSKGSHTPRDTTLNS
jgi:hypothetical protein